MLIGRLSIVVDRRRPDQRKRHWCARPAFKQTQRRATTPAHKIHHHISCRRKNISTHRDAITTSETDAHTQGPAKPTAKPTGNLYTNSTQNAERPSIPTVTTSEPGKAIPSPDPICLNEANDKEEERTKLDRPSHVIVLSESLCKPR